MNLLINASNLRVGGGVQVAISFITEIERIENVQNDNYIFVVSKEVYSELNEHIKQKFEIIVFESSPSSILGWKYRVKLLYIERKYKIDVVFSIFGATFWKPVKAKHLVGFALPWLIYDTKKVLKKLSYVSQLKTRLVVKLQKYSLASHADELVVETFDAAERVSSLLGFSRSKVHVVSNAASSNFNKTTSIPDSKSKLFDYTVNCKSKFLLTITYPHIHKNLEVIPEVLKYLNEDVKFVVTVPDSFYSKHFKGCESRIINLNRVDNEDCPALYRLVDGVFLPSLLECFSANYPEAFISKKIVFTSDLPFARTVCKDAVFYFDPYSPKHIANVISAGFENNKEKENKIGLGNSILDDLMTPEMRALKYLSLCRDLVNSK